LDPSQTLGGVPDGEREHRRYCYPLTITDSASRYLFACEAPSTTKEAYAFPVFEAVFKQFGLPRPK
jgi:putative transposase